VVVPRRRGENFFEVTVSDVTKKFGEGPMTIDEFRKRLGAEFAIPRHAAVDISFDVPVGDGDGRARLDGWPRYDAAMSFASSSGNIHPLTN
jgi:hypothetical protein